MKNGGLLNRIFNVDRGNEENEDDRYFLERSFLLDRPGGGGLHFFLFSFHGKSLTIFEERERERGRLSRNLFADGIRPRMGGVGMDFRRLGGAAYVVLSSYGNEIELERFCFYGCNLLRGCELTVSILRNGHPVYVTLVRYPRI